VAAEGGGRGLYAQSHRGERIRWRVAPADSRFRFVEISVFISARAQCAREFLPELVTCSLSNRWIH